jgi:hypothetical protein
MAKIMGGPIWTQYIYTYVYIYIHTHTYIHIHYRYETALSHEPNDPTTLSNYGLFMQTVRHDYARAEEVYKRALEIDGGHVEGRCILLYSTNSICKHY